MTQQPDHDDQTVVSVTVARSGGIAGMTRRWAAAAPPGDPQTWTRLVDECPWDQCGDDGAAAARATTSAPPRGADRFTWSVEAVVGGGSPRRAALREGDASGPWRTLIDAVREAAASSPR